MKNRYLLFLSIMGLIVFVSGTIDMNLLLNYSNQPIPSYISEDNTPSVNPTTDEGATLGRVLFYDKKLSLTNTVSCSSCHKQELAFGDSEIQSVGHDGGLTGRHSPRLSSARFGEEENFFWDERASSLEEQSTMPLQDHIEMGFSGSNGDPDIDSLIRKLSDLYYYEELFNLTFGDEIITEERIQNALAQFIRSMQSFDSRYDVGRRLVGNDLANFPNFTDSENNGKALYMNNNASGCNRCHRAPEFDIDPNSNNNGVIGVAGSPGSIDLTNTRSPSLRDIVNASGVENGPYMHDGSLATLLDVINHYDDVPNLPINTNLDIRLQGNGGDLNLTNTEKLDLLAFLKTLGGSNLYTNEKWSDPFSADGEIEILNGVLPIELSYFTASQEGDNIQLDWETFVEVNNDGFEIMYSDDLSDWEMLDFVIGNNEPSQYSYLHLDPPSGIHYYRLKQYDFDGQSDLSDIISVRIEARNETVSMYPNPTYDFVHVEASSSFEIASIYGSNGQLVKQVTINESVSIDLSELESGAYFIQLYSPSQNVSEMSKVIKM